jgi:hypothetical protein
LPDHSLASKLEASSATAQMLRQLFVELLIAWTGYFVAQSVCATLHDLDLVVYPSTKPSETLFTVLQYSRSRTQSNNVKR